MDIRDCLRVCGVCGGNGFVPVTGDGGNQTQDWCDECNGTGLVWREPSDFPFLSNDDVYSLVCRLQKYNLWRRGEDFEQPSPKELGLDIDSAIALISINNIYKALEDENLIEKKNSAHNTVGFDAIAIRLSKDIKKMDELIHGLDNVARDVCSYEYGLPISDDGQIARMREVIIKWIVSV